MAGNSKIGAQAGDSLAHGLPLMSQDDPRRKLSTFQDRCLRVTNFPNDREREDWYLPVRPTEAIHRQLSSGFDRDQTEKFRAGVERYQHGCDFVVPEAFVACIHDAKIFSRDFLVLSRAGDIFRESALGLNEVLESSAIMETLIRPRLTRLAGDYCLLASPWSGHSYYHWMFDALPRLGTIRQCDGLNDTRLLVRHELKAFHRQSLEIAGIPEERLVRFDSGYWQVDRLYFPGLPSETGNPSPHAVAWLRSTFLRSPDTRSAERLLYVSRGDALSRKVRNEVEIVEYLTRRGFECVCPGALSLVEQVELFSEAKIVVGPHGAGFTNMVFAPKGATLIEFFGESYVNGCYWALTNICEQNHAYIVAPTETLDYEVSLEQLRLLLDRAT